MAAHALKACIKALHSRHRNSNEGRPLSKHGLWLLLAILEQTSTAAVALDDLL